MAANTSGNGNLLIAFLKLAAFLLLLFFLIPVTYRFCVVAHGSGDIGQLFLPSTIFFVFFYYLFVADLNEIYKKIQEFLFRIPWLAHLIPFALILASGIYLLMIKVFNLSIDGNIFIFTGGFIFAMHMIYVARNIRGETFAALADYLFAMTLYYMANLIFLGFYFVILFNFNVVKVFLDGGAMAIDLMRDYFL